MTTIDQHKSFLDTSTARVLALLLAVLLIFVLWMNWSSQFSALVTQKEDVVSNRSAQEPAKPLNAALENCLTQRVGDVDRMKEEGILSEAQYGAFRARAESLCKAQNPG